MSFLTFLLGLALGALYAPVVKPLVLKVWHSFQGWINQKPPVE
jgi:hypothetical protein